MKQSMIDLKVKMKTSWDEITVSEIQQLSKLSLDINDDNGAETLIKMLSIVSDKTYDELMDMDISHIKMIAPLLNFLNDVPEVKSMPKSSYVINGTTYKPQLEVAKLKAGQWIDIVYWDRKKDKAEHLHEFLAYIMTPNGEEYSEDTFNKAIKDMPDMPIIAAREVSNFFLLNYQSLLKGIDNYLVSNMKTAKKKAPTKKILKEMEDMIAKYTDSTNQTGRS